MAIEARFDLPMAEALEFWRAKVRLPPKEFYALAESHRVRAFTVSGLARADMIHEIYRSMGRALESGETFEEWKKSLAHIWEENGWTGKRAWRVDNIFRTNIQTAYNAGRYKQMMEVSEGRPYWQYSAVNDSRTRPTHRALHGRVYRHDSPFWDTFYPPNGFRCRCKVKTLSERQVRERGLKVWDGNGLGELIEPPGPGGTTLPARPLMPDKGFAGNRGKEAWQADLSKYPTRLREGLLKGMIDDCWRAGMDFAEFAASDCLVRMSRALRQEHVQELETLVWARKAEIQTTFAVWVGSVLSSMRPRGELFPVGNLPDNVLSYLALQKISPRVRLIVLDDHQLTHLARDKKVGRGAALRAQEIFEIPERVVNGRWFFDKHDPQALLAWARIGSGQEWLKVAVRLDRKPKGTRGIVVNQIVTGGVVMDDNMLLDPRYEAI